MGLMNGKIEFKNTWNRLGFALFAQRNPKPIKFFGLFNNVVRENIQHIVNTNPEI